MRRVLLSILLSLFLCACSTTSQFKSVSTQQNLVQAQVVEKTRQSVRASMEAIKSHDETLSLRFSESALTLLGGEPLHPVDIKGLSNTTDQDSFFEEFQKDNLWLMELNGRLIQEKAELQQIILEKAKKQESSTLWEWIRSIVAGIGVGGAIILFICVPTLLPLVVSAVIVGIKWLASVLRRLTE